MPEINYDDLFGDLPSPGEQPKAAAIPAQALQQVGVSSEGPSPEQLFEGTVGVTAEAPKAPVAGSSWKKDQPAYVQDEWSGKNLGPVGKALQPIRNDLFKFGTGSIIGLQRTLTGATQLALDAADEVANAPYKYGIPGGTTAFKDLREQLPKFEDYESKNAQHYPEGFFDTAYKAGAMASDVATGAAVASKLPVAKTVAGRLISALTTGLGFGTMEYLPEDAPEHQRWLNAATSGALNIAGGGLLEVLHWKSTYASNLTKRVFPSEADKKLSHLDDALWSTSATSNEKNAIQRGIKESVDYTKKGFELERATGMPMLPAQISKTPAAEAVTRRTAEIYPDRVSMLAAGQASKHADDYLDLVAKVRPSAGFTEANVGERIADTSGKILTNLRVVQDRNWQSKLQTAVKETEGRHIVPISSVANKMDMYIKNATRHVSVVDKDAFTSVMRQHAKDLEDATGLSRMGIPINKFVGESEMLRYNPSLGKLTVQQLSDELVAVTKRISETDGGAKLAHSKYKTILLDMVDDTVKAEGANTPLKKGLETLVSMRDRYKDDEMLKRTIISTPVQKLLKSSDPRVGEKIFSLTSKMPDSRFRAWFTALRDADEKTANAYAARLLDNAYEKTMQKGDFDATEVIKNLPIGEKFNIIFGGSFKGRQDLKQWIDMGKRVGLIDPINLKSGTEVGQQMARSAGFAAAGAAKGRAMEAVNAQFGWLGGLIVKAGQAPIAMKFIMLPEGRAALARSNAALTKWHKASRLSGPLAMEAMQQAQQERMVSAADITALWNGLISNDQTKTTETQQ